MFNIIIVANCVVAKFKTCFHFVLWIHMCPFRNDSVYWNDMKEKMYAKTKIVQLTHYFYNKRKHEMKKTTTATKKTIDISATAVTSTLATYFFFSQICCFLPFSVTKTRIKWKQAPNKTAEWTNEWKENVSKYSRSHTQFHFIEADRLWFVV